MYAHVTNFAMVYGTFDTIPPVQISYMVFIADLAKSLEMLMELFLILKNWMPMVQKIAFKHIVATYAALSARRAF